ncbi:MAG: hypothetical protein H0X64_08165 [Gemmatimonadaceae bacterium]|nr:hypothetical protein [Gemmatimonadaceae bacterium]
MGRFGAELREHVVKVKATTGRIFVGSAALALESIQVGSPVTGSPGQPVGQYGPGYHEGEVGGELKTSWNMTFESPTIAAIQTNVAHAPSNEDGIARPGGGAYNQRSTVGGRHSVALTVAGWDNIVEHITAQEARG